MKKTCERLEGIFRMINKHIGYKSMHEKELSICLLFIVNVIDKMRFCNHNVNKCCLVGRVAKLHYLLCIHNVKIA